LIVHFCYFEEVIKKSVRSSKLIKKIVANPVCIAGVVIKWNRLIESVDRKKVVSTVFKIIKKVEEQWMMSTSGARVTVFSTKRL